MSDLLIILLLFVIMFLGMPLADMWSNGKTYIENLKDVWNNDRKD